ncbi:unnamed protein product, partial [Rotaria sp. Silwood1]
MAERSSAESRQPIATRSRRAVAPAVIVDTSSQDQGPSAGIHVAPTPTRR